MITEQNNKKKKLSKEDILDLAEILVDALVAEEDLESARHLLRPVPGAERIELFSTIRMFCKQKKIKLPAERLATLLLEHPKLQSSTWANYFCGIYRIVASTDENKENNDILLRIFNDAFNYYRNPQKGYAQLSRAHLGEFMRNCPDAGSLMLSSLEKALQKNDYSFLEVFGTALWTLFQENSGVGKLNPEIAGRILERLSEVPTAKVPPELFAVLPSLCLRCQQIPRVYAASDQAAQLKLRNLYPVQMQNAVTTGPAPAEVTRAESIAVMLESVPEFIRRLDQLHKDNETENKQLKKRIETSDRLAITLQQELEKLTTKHARENRQNREDCKVKDEEIATLKNEATLLEKDKNDWRHEHEFLEQHSTRKLKANQERLLIEITDKLGGQVKNMRDNINRILNGTELSAVDIQTLAAAFNSLCKTFNRVAHGEVERIPNDIILNFKTEPNKS